MAGDNWLNTRGGQEFASTFKRIAQALEKLVEQDKEERSTLVTTRDIFFKQKVADRAWDLFKQEVDKAELIPPADERCSSVISEKLMRHYATKCFEMATLFTALEDTK
jgi:hypothetical protein